jgi:hypothetical protein
MSRLLLLMLATLLLVGCAHDDLKAPCRHSALALFARDCGPVRPVQ